MGSVGLSDFIDLHANGGGNDAARQAILTDRPIPPLHLRNEAVSGFFSRLMERAYFFSSGIMMRNGRSRRPGVSRAGRLSL
jgi:hypothetical protein